MAPRCMRQSAVPTKANNVPVFLPFRGVRYRGLTDLSAVAAPPYDVIHDDERDVLERRDAHNAVRLILPRAEDGHDEYATAALTFPGNIIATNFGFKGAEYFKGAPEDQAVPKVDLGLTPRA